MKRMFCLTMTYFCCAFLVIHSNAFSPGQNNAHGSAHNSPNQSYQTSSASREVYFAPAPHTQQVHQVSSHQQPSPPQQHQLQHSGTGSGDYYGQQSLDMSMRNGAVSNHNHINGIAGGNAPIQYYGQNTYYFTNGGSCGMHATEQDQSYYKNMFIELGFGEPNPPVAQPGHQDSMAYAHHMPQHANYNQ